MTAAERLRARLNRDVAMVGLAIVSIAILGYEEFADPDAAMSRNLLLLDLAIVGVFWVEYAWRYKTALQRYPSRLEFVKDNWYDLPGMVPILPGMEAIGGVRVLRLLRILRILRLVGALRRFERFDRAAQRFTRQSKLGYVALMAFGIIATCGTLAWIVEPATYPTLSDGLWWAVVTATTVGYGDFYPRTGAGRVLGVALMFLGVALIGTFAATLSSFLVERRFEDQQREDRAAGIAAPEQPLAAGGALPVPGMQVAMELERLARLHEGGKLSDAEFAAAKRRLLG